MTLKDLLKNSIRKVKYVKRMEFGLRTITTTTAFTKASIGEAFTIDDSRILSINCYLFTILRASSYNPPLPSPHQLPFH